MFYLFLFWETFWENLTVTFRDFWNAFSIQKLILMKEFSKEELIYTLPDRFQQAKMT